MFILLNSPLLPQNILDKILHSQNYTLNLKTEYKLAYTEDRKYPTY